MAVHVFVLTMSLTTFFAGTQANDSHFQAYVLEGIVRWNEDRAATSISPTTTPGSGLRSYSGEMRHAVHQLSVKVLGTPVELDYRPPGAYTGNSSDFLLKIPVQLKERT